MKTHIVIDLVYHEDEGNQAFIGTHQECVDFVADQGFGFEIVPMTKQEYEFENKEE